MAVYDTLKGGLGNKVAYASGGSSPSQWAEYTPARGRCVCGLPNSGTNEGTVGTAFTDDQDKSFTVDTHSVSEAEMPAHGHDVRPADPRVSNRFDASRHSSASLRRQQSVVPRPGDF